MRLNVNKYKELMFNKNIDNAYIEKKAGFSMNTINWIFENGFVEISTLERLADVVECPTTEIALPDYNNIENAIEWINDEKTATLSLTQGRTIVNVKSLACH